jgi:putative peptidoglycan lipid II flippase
MALKRILNIQTKNITLAAFILGAASFISAVLGLLRDRLLASHFGAGNELDAYYAAFRIPDFISMVLIMGAISAAIIPVFNEYLVRSKKKAFEFLSNLFNLFLFILIIALIFLVIFAPQLMDIIAPGFSGEKKNLTVVLTRIMFLSPILLGLSNIISSILQVFRRFVITSLTPIVYNLGIIFGILFLAPRFGVQGLAWGVALGAALHLAIQLPFLFKVGFRPIKIFNFRHTGFLKVIKLTIPRSIGLAASQINLVVVTAIGSTLVPGSITVLNLADNLARPVLTLIAVSFFLASFPTLSLAFSKRNKEKFNQTFSMTFSRTLYLVLPLSLLLFLLRGFVVSIILKVGKFGLIDADLTAACLGMFAFGLFAQSLIILLANAFYALQDTKTPALSSVAGMVANTILAFLLVKLFSFPNSIQQFFINFFNLQNISHPEVIGLPLAISLSAIIQFLIIFSLFQRKRVSAFNGKNS